MTAVAAERDALCRGLDAPVDVALGPYQGPDTGAVTVLAGGVGPAAAAACTATALTRARYDAVLSVGIGGGFAGRADVGDVVVADWCVAADLGADSPAGFLPLSDLGFGEETVPVSAPRVDLLAAALRGAGLVVRVGAVLTVSTVTGTAERAEVLAGRGAPVAEAMEGYGVAATAATFGVPAAEIRTVSNLVGPRDRGGWDLPRALDALARVGGVLLGGNVLTGPND